jgi:tRNA (adenine22-N1)-methyltransferase
LKIGKRLQSLDKAVTRRYDQIWDCCCDHGLLGMLLLKRQAAKVIHFIDIAPVITDALTVRLQQYFPLDSDNATQSTWRVHCSDVTALDLAKASAAEDTHLMIIAGVGGERTIDLMQAILNRNPTLTIEFLLCPVFHIFQLRQALAHWQLGLIAEQIILDKGRFYEVIHVAKNLDQPIAPVGSLMWDCKSNSHRQYLEQTIAFYQRNAQDPKKNVAPVLKAYQSKLAEFDLNKPD